jgi:mRNA interferase RelE/StbE
MSYSVYLKKSAEKELLSLSSAIHDKIIKHLVDLEQNQLPKGVKKLRGMEAYRLRVGDYRILYQIKSKKKIIEIVAITHRKDAYR